MADDQGHNVEQGAEDPTNDDTVDAKPDRVLFCRIDLEVSFLSH